MKKTTIKTAYDAFWFLTNHPKLNCPEALLVTTKQAKRLAAKGERVREVGDESPWLAEKRYWLREFDLNCEAMQYNLDIHYAMVDRHRRVNDDPAKNTIVECWLEFGPVEKTVFEGKLLTRSCHDPNLDCGAPTFDEALVKLARLVKKHYGDYSD